MANHIATNADDHVFPRVRYLGDGRRLSTEMRSYVTPICSRRQLERTYAPVTIPDWVDDDRVDNTMSSLEEIHKFTFQSVLECGFYEIHQPPQNVYDTITERWRRATQEEINEKTKIYNFKRVLREIEVRGPDIKTDKLAKWKSPIYSQMRRDAPIKGAHTAISNCGGGGGGAIACC